MTPDEAGSYVDPRDYIGVDEVAVASAVGGDSFGMTHLLCVRIRGTRLGVAGEPVEVPELVLDQEGTVVLLAALIRAGSDAWGRDGMVAAFADALGVPGERAVRAQRRVEDIVREERLR